MKKKSNPEVKRVIDSYSKERRKPLHSLRDLIYDVAESTTGVGLITESLKWGQPSFATDETGAGTPVRIAHFGKSQIAMFVSCQTTLIDTFRSKFPELEYSGTRAIVLDPAKPLPVSQLSNFIAAALTYKLAKKSGKSN